MAEIKEIREHIKSVGETLKITNAMYLISSSSLRQAKKRLDQSRPYFERIKYTIADILYHSPKVHHKYFDQRQELKPEERKVGCIVVTGDKGLAGAYNHNVLKLAQEFLAEKTDPILYVIGQAGRAWFAGQGVKLDGEFEYTAQNPTMTRAREIGQLFLELFSEHKLDEVWIIYTRMVSPLHVEPTSMKLLPLHRDLFSWERPATELYNKRMRYIPSEEAVMDRLVPSYLYGTLFGALVESFCSEQDCRMMAMSASSDNARKMLQELNLTYNRARQAAITQEITEITSAAAALGDQG
jgi:F-type H+-transporting ATPase subunit gamma